MRALGRNNSYPTNNTAVDALFGAAATYVTLSYTPSHAADMLATGAWPAATNPQVTGDAVPKRLLLPLARPRTPSQAPLPQRPRTDDSIPPLPPNVSLVIPVMAQGYVMSTGNLANTNFVAIPTTSRNKLGAAVAANFLGTPQANYYRVLNLGR